MCVTFIVNFNLQKDKFFVLENFISFLKIYYFCTYNLLTDCNWAQTHKHLVHKQTLNHLAKLAKWLSCVASTCLCEAFDYKLFSCYYEFHSESTLYSCLNAKKLLTWNGCHIWSLSDSNRIQIHKALSS